LSRRAVVREAIPGQEVVQSDAQKGHFLPEGVQVIQEGGGWPGKADLERLKAEAQWLAKKTELLNLEGLRYDKMNSALRRDHRDFGVTYFPSVLPLNFSAADLKPRMLKPKTTPPPSPFPLGFFGSMFRLVKELQGENMPDRVTQVALGENTASFLTAHGRVFSCGRGARGQLGYPSNAPPKKPRVIEALFSRAVVQPSVRIMVTKLSVGRNHTMALDDMGRLFGWGDNSMGQCGYQTAINVRDGVSFSSTPRLVSFDKKIWVTDVSAGQTFTIAILKGMLYSFGEGKFLGQGQFYKGSDSHRPRIVRLANQEVVKFHGVSTGTAHVAAVASSGKVYCWGSNEFSQCGRPAGEKQGRGNSKARFLQVATEVPSLANVIDVKCGGRHNICLTRKGEVFAFGWNKYSQCGEGSETKSCIVKPQKVVFYTPRLPVPNNKMKYISAGENYNVSMGGDGSVWRWGLEVDAEEVWKGGKVEEVIMEDDEEHWGKRTGINVSWSPTMSFTYLDLHVDVEAMALNKRDFLRRKLPTSEPKKNKYGNDSYSIDSSVQNRGGWNNSIQKPDTIKANPFLSKREMTPGELSQKMRKEMTKLGSTRTPNKLSKEEQKRLLSEKKKRVLRRKLGKMEDDKKARIIEVKSLGCSAMKGLLAGPIDDEVFTESEEEKEEEDGVEVDEDYDSGDGGDLVSDSDIVEKARKMQARFEEEAEIKKEEKKKEKEKKTVRPPPPPNSAPPSNAKVGVVKKRKPPPPPAPPTPAMNGEEKSAAKEEDYESSEYHVSDIEDETPIKRVQPVTVEGGERKKWVVKGADLENVGLPSRKTIVVPPSMKPPPPASPPPLSAIKASEPRRRSLLERRNSNGGFGSTMLGIRRNTVKVTGLSITAMIGLKNNTQGEAKE